MRAIANEQVDGFPPPSELRTVYVEHDIDASQSEMAVVEFVFKDPALQGTSHPEHETVEQVRHATDYLVLMALLYDCGYWSRAVASADQQQIIGYNLQTY